MRAVVLVISMVLCCSIVPTALLRVSSVPLRFLLLALICVPWGILTDWLIARMERPFLRPQPRRPWER